MDAPRGGNGPLNRPDASASGANSAWVVVALLLLLLGFVAILYLV